MTAAAAVPRAGGEPGEPLPAAGQWRILHTRSRQERTVERQLRVRGVGVYLPLVPQVRYYGRRKVRRELPAFPGYVFVRGEREEAWLAERAGRLVSVIEVRDQQRLDHELRQVHLALSCDPDAAVHPYLATGVEVEVRSGPWRGMRGRVESREAMGRIVLQIETLGQAICVEIDGSLLDVLD